MTRDLLWPGIVAVSTAAMAVVASLGLGPPIAPLVAGWFVLVCPGLPYVRLLNLGDPLNEFLLVVALSLSLESVVSLVLLWGSSWTPDRMLQIVIAITVLGVLLDADRSFRRGRATSSPEHASAQ